MSTLFYGMAKQAIMPIVKPLGFRCQGRFYSRIINDVVQQFCLLWHNHDFTIRFCISSVYSDNDKFIEGDEVTKLINGSNNMWLGQQFVKNELTQHFFQQCSTSTLLPNYDACVNTCVDVLGNYLIPWFCEASSSYSAYKMAKEAKLFSTLYQEPESYRYIGFLLDMEQWEQCITILKYYLNNSQLYNPKWWKEKEQEYQGLYEALIKKDTRYLNLYMNSKKSETYRVFGYKK